MSLERTTYHVMLDDSGEVLILIKLRMTAGSTDGQIYHPGQGWLPDSRAFDVMLNGQDYDLVDESRVEELTAAMEKRPD